MKKILLAATAVALLPLLFACNKNNGGDTRFEDPRFVQYAGQLIPCSDPTPTKTVLIETPENTLHSIELTESGVYAVGTLTEGRLSYKTGTYSVDGQAYNLAGYGTLRFDNSSTGEVDVLIDRPGQEAEIMRANFNRAKGSDQLYRGWTVDKTRVTIKGWTTASADFQGCNFYDIAKFIRDNGHDVPDDITPGMALSSISFTGTEKILFAYTDGTGDAGEFRFNGSSFTYRWDDEKMGFTFLTDQATVEYMDGKCILTISASIQDSTTRGSVTFVLSPMA